MRTHLMFLGIIAALAVFVLEGCSAYTQSADMTPANDVRTDARACQFATANPAQLIPLVALVTAPQAFSDMDGCMAQKGWVRK